MKRHFLNNRIIAATLLSLLLLLVVSSPGDTFAASKDAETKAVNKTVTTFFNDVKSYRYKRFENSFQPKKYRSGYTIWVFTTNGAKVDLSKQIKTMHKDHLKWEITGTSLKGSSAEVKVTVTYFDADVLMAYSFYQGVVDAALAGNESSTTKIYKAIAKCMDSNYKKCRKNKECIVSNKTITIPMIRRNGKWLIKTPTPELQYIMDCGITHAYLMFKDY